MSNERKLRKRFIKNIDNVFNGKRDLNSLIITLKILKDDFETEYQNVSIQREYYGYDGGNEINLIGYTLETDEEFEKRISTEKKKQEAEEKKRVAKEAREKKKLEQLKEKYGS